MPLMTPIGTAKAAPIPISISVPTMEFAMPPPDSPTGTGMCVKKSRLSEKMPCVTTKKRMKPERHQRQQHREGAQPDDHLREEPANHVVLHAAPPTGAATGATTRRTVTGRFMCQISTRDAMLTISVMAKSTSPTSISASR